ncbi:alpha-1,6-mannosyl-glycoprotein 2-beta-N-acetylglucosaminyltransferase [Tanacetum coccineum]
MLESQDMVPPPVEGVAVVDSNRMGRWLVSHDTLTIGQALKLRRVVPILGVPDALVPIDMPVSQINLLPGTPSRDISMGEFIVSATKADAECVTQYQLVERVKSATTTLRRVLVSPSFSDFFSENGPPDMMDISDTVIEDRFGVEHGSAEWYDALEKHFKWLLQYRISPYFCKWGNSMRVLTYTSPWPADHPKSDEFFSDPRLAAYAVPYSPVIPCGDLAKDYLQKEVEILRSKVIGRKPTFTCGMSMNEIQNRFAFEGQSTPLKDLILKATNIQLYDAIRPNKASEIRDYAYVAREWVIGNREDLVKDIIAEIRPENGEEWWTYVCMGPSDPHPNWHLGMRGTQHRAVMWRVWKEGGTGFLYWGANCYEKATVASAEIKFRRGLPPGDGVLYYPGEVFSSSHEPVASLRLERLLSGLQDIEYLKLYSSRYGREEGLAILEKTGSGLVVFALGMTHYKSWPHDPNAFVTFPYVVHVLWRLKSSSGKGIEFDTLLGNFGGNGPKSNDVKRRDLVRDHIQELIKCRTNYLLRTFNSSSSKIDHIYGHVDNHIEADIAVEMTMALAATSIDFKKDNSCYYARLSASFGFSRPLANRIIRNIGEVHKIIMDKTKPVTMDSLMVIDDAVEKILSEVAPAEDGAAAMESTGDAVQDADAADAMEDAILDEDACAAMGSNLDEDAAAAMEDAIPDEDAGDAMGSNLDKDAGAASRPKGKGKSKKTRENNVVVRVVTRSQRQKQGIPAPTHQLK